MKNLIKIGLLSLSLLFFFSCGHKEIFETTVTPLNQEWNIFKPIDFNFDIKDTSKPYALNLVLKIDQSKMTEKSIPITYNLVYPNSENRADFKNLVLEKGKNKNNEFEFVLINYKQFNNPGKYKLSVSQTSSRFNLEGIEAVTLRINETKVRKANEDEE